MKLQRNSFRWTGMAIILIVFVSFAFLLPSVFAQGENTLTPAPEVTPEPLATPEIQQESGVQSLMSLPSNAELGGDWAVQVNISDTAEESFKPKIAADGNGNLHIVWRETISGNQEIFYTWIDVDQTIQSLPVNVSNSPSFHSQSPQLVVDSAGIAHIVWQDKDGADHYEVFYSHCDLDKPELMTFATSPKSDLSV